MSFRPRRVVPAITGIQKLVWSVLAAGLLTVAAPLPILAQPGPLPAAVPGAPAGGAPAEARSKAEAQNPSPIDTFQVDAGYLAAFKGGGKNAFYYKLQYKGSLLTQKGTPFSSTNVNNPVPVPDPASPGGDTNALSLRLERGNATANGALFDALGVRSLQLPRSLLGDLRGVVQLSGQLDGSQLNFAVGLETPPAHPLDFLNRSQNLGITNWLILGLQGEAENRAAQRGGNEDLALLTYRSFFGQGYHWVRSHRLDDKLARAILSKTPTYTAAKAFADTFRRAATQPTDLDSVIVGLADLGAGASQAGDTQEQSAARWKEAVETAARAYQAPPDQPTFAVWLEDAGWFDISRPRGSARFNNLAALTMTLWIDPRTGDSRWLRLRYENGNDRGDPTVHKNFVSVSVGTRL